MCFSAGASFTAGAVLGTIGVATARRVQNPSQKLFAGIPFLFAFQQCAEGVLWLTLGSGGNSEIQAAAVYIFLLTALVIWPVMIPLSLLRLEGDEKKKKIIRRFLFAAVLLSAYYAFCLLPFNISPHIRDFHIQYVSDFPVSLRLPVFAIYLLVTITPLFVSTVKGMSFFAVLICLSCLVTGIFYREFLTSVWCFFAAMISIVVYVIIRESNEDFSLADFKLLSILSDRTNRKNRFRR